MTESPCVGICILDNDVCIGCGRTSDEIYQAGIDAMRRLQDPPETPRPSPTPDPTPVPTSK